MKDLVNEGRKLQEKFSKIFENSNFPDQVEGNHGIIFKKVSQSGNTAKYNIYYRGYDIDTGGYVFGSVGELERFMKDYILSNSLYNKYKNMPEKPINEADEDISKSNDVRNIIDNQNLTVLIPRNYEAVRDLTVDTKWSTTFTSAAFSRYQKQKFTVYFVVLKKGSPSYNNRNYRKMAVLVSPSGEYTCYDSTGTLIDITNIIKITSLPRMTFKQLK
jgi:hypothetical protein